MELFARDCCGVYSGRNNFTDGKTTAATRWLDRLWMNQWDVTSQQTGGLKTPNPRCVHDPAESHRRFFIFISFLFYSFQCFITAPTSLQSHLLFVLEKHIKVIYEFNGSFASGVCWARKFLSNLWLDNNPPPQRTRTRTRFRLWLSQCWCPAPLSLCVSSNAVFVFVFVSIESVLLWGVWNERWLCHNCSFT